MKIVEASYFSQNWDCKNGIIYFDLSDEIVILDDINQNGDPFEDIRIHEINPTVSNLTRIYQIEYDF